jgi:hypothetical protein
MIARSGNLDLDSGARQVVRCQQKKEELNFEPMLDYKSPNTALGAATCKRSNGTIYRVSGLKFDAKVFLKVSRVQEF